jgi:hypothetical protein
VWLAADCPLLIGATVADEYRLAVEPFGCCETTAREAYQHDFRVVFLSDGTATREMNGVAADDLQRATRASLGMVFAQIATINDVRDRLRATTTPVVATVSH